MMSYSLFTLKQLSSFLSLHPNTIYKLVEKRGIPFIKIKGVGIRFRKEDIEAWLEEGSNKNRQITAFLPKFDLTLENYDKIFLKGESALRKKSRRWNYGFGAIYVRETKQGKKRWYVDFKENGRRVRRVAKNAQTKGQAVLVLHNTVAEIFNKEHNPGREREKIKFRKFADMYLDNYAKVNKKSWRCDQYRIEAHMKPFFGDLRLQDITPLSIEKYRAERLKTGVTKSTLNRELTIMKKMFNLAIDWKFADQNPAAKVKLFSEKDTQKEKIITEQEEAKLLSESPDYLKPILLTALYAGMRRGEILKLKWRQVDLDKRCVRTINTKGGKSRVIPINSLLFQELLKVKRQNRNSEYVFPNPKTEQPFTELKKSFKAACKRAGIEDLRFHDLRHTFATRLVESGSDIVTVRDLLGHFSVRVTQRYTHSSQKRKEKAVERLTGVPPKEAENTEKLSHICHISKKGNLNKFENALFSVN